MIKILMNFSKLSMLSILLSVLMVSSAFAHVTVKPGEVATASYTTFTVSVPNEKLADTVGIKLLIPESLSSVTPTVKPGWSISTEQEEATGDDAHSGVKVSSISWTGGSIPKGQRDDFTFSAKTPSQDNSLEWKAYQTYSDGVVVSWDKSDVDQPKKEDGSPDFSESGPFSVTKVTENVEVTNADSSNTENTVSVNEDIEKKASRAFYVSIAAIIVSLIGLAIATRTRK